MENTNGNGKVIGALLLGTALGALLGILFAPDKGSETRKKISAKGSDIKDKLTDLLNNIQSEAETARAKRNEFAESETQKARTSKSI